MNETRDRPKVKLIGEDGNAFAIMGACRRAFLKAGNSLSDWEKIAEDMQSGDYDHLLKVAMKHFDVE